MPQQRSRASEFHELDVYAGREWIGSVVEAAGRCKATGADGSALGEFPSRKNAMAAVCAWHARKCAGEG